MLSLCDGPTLRRVASCSKQLHALAADTLRCPTWRAALSTEVPLLTNSQTCFTWLSLLAPCSLILLTTYDLQADVEARVALAVIADKAPSLTPPHSPP